MPRSIAFICLLAAVLFAAAGCTPKTTSPPDQGPIASVEVTDPDPGDTAEPEEMDEETQAPEAAPDLPEEELQAMLDQAQEHLDDGDWDAALGVYDELASLAPNHAEVWVGRGVVLRGLAQPEDGDLDDRVMEEAIENFTTALDLDESMAEAYYERGLAYSAVGRTYFMEDGALGQRGEEALMEARADFRKALALNPDDPQTLLARGDVHEALGDCYNAVEDYERVLDLIPGNTTALEGIARCEETLDE